MYHHTTACLLETVTRTGRDRRASVNRVLHAGRPAAQPPEERAEEADIRHELVARVRREIKEGTYDTPEKLALALDRMLDDVS